MPSTKLVVGLTGGIGSGKSTVAILFADRGVTVIDTDQLARDLTQSDQPAFNKIVEKFGTGILTPDGELNRKNLRKIVFAESAHRFWLESLLHPLIREELNYQVALIHSPYCIAVIPLLLETKPNPLIKRILVVDTTVELQIKRTQLRDKLSHTEIDLILKTQVSREKRLAAAEDVIYNNGSLEELIPQVDELHKFYLSIS